MNSRILRVLRHSYSNITNRTFMEGEDNLTAVLYGINDIRLEQRPIRKPKNDGVLLKMGVVGICGSDVHYLVDGKIGHFVVEKPMVIGHEASGTVVKVGKDVKNLKIGDRVGIEPGYGCRKCSYCKKGRYNLCLDMRFCATPPIDGNLSRYYTHPADFCFKLPDNVSLEEGALLEPLSVGVHGCNRGNVRVGSKVLILGAGPIGLVTLLTAKAYGASQVVVTDIKKRRLKLAKKLGAHETILVKKDDDSEELSQKIICAFDESGPDISIDCAGSEQTVKIAVSATKSGGTALLIGMGKSDIKLPLMNALIREVDIKGCFRYVNCYPIAVDLIASGRVNVKPLITHHFPMEETEKAFKTVQTPEEESIKVLIHADPDWNQC